LNLIGDFGGGSMLLVVGVLAALVERATSGRGQVVDAAMVDGSALLMSIFHVFDQFGPGMWARGTNLLDGGAHFYGGTRAPTASTSASRPSSRSSMRSSPHWWGLGMDGLGAAGLAPRGAAGQSAVAELRERLAAMFRTRTRDAWVAFFAGHGLLRPVLSMAEARRHPHNVARGTFTTVDGSSRHAPAPRFSRTPGAIANAPRAAGADTDAALRDWGSIG
jgi:alpha-methylacyl-CoA racemase